MDKKDLLRKVEKAIHLTKNDNDAEAVQALRTAINMVESHTGLDLPTFMKGAEADSLRAELGKAKIEILRLRRENRQLKAYVPQASDLNGYQAELAQWFHLNFLRDKKSWHSTQQLKEWFEKSRPRLAALETSAIRFSKYFKEVSGLTSVKGGGYGIKGFQVRPKNAR